MEDMMNSVVGNNQSPIKKALMILALVFVGGFLYQWVSSPMLVTVQGVSEVSVKATAANLSFTLTQNDASPNGAINNVKTRAEGMKQVLMDAGAQSSEIRMSQVQVLPASVTGGSGFQAVLSVSGKITDIDNIDKTISILYDRGATIVNQPTLETEDSDDLEKQAFNEAVKDAKQKAGLIGNKNLKFVRKVVAVSESTPVSAGTTGQTEGGSELSGMVNPQQLNLTTVKLVTVSYKMW